MHNAQLRTFTFGSRSGDFLTPAPQLSLEIGLTDKMSTKCKPPIFVVGCPRSGTTLLYSLLLSSGRFALYLAETEVFHRIAPAFGNLRFRSERRKLIDAWLDSDFFRRTGLGREPLCSQLIERCTSPGDFLQIVMGSLAEQQGVERWADNSPLHVLFIPNIKKAIPNAKFIHIIRDGRDVAMSLNALGWNICRPLPWDRAKGLVVAGLYWEWVVRKGQKYGRSLSASDYIEVHFEDLVRYPQGVLETVGSFVGENLDYERIQQKAVGAFAKPNSAFALHRDKQFNPVARWKDLVPDEAWRMISLLAPLLEQLGYKVTAARRSTLIARWQRALYFRYFDLKLVVRKSSFSRLIVSKDVLRAGFLDKLDAVWEAIRNPPYACSNHANASAETQTKRGPHYSQVSHSNS